MVSACHSPTLAVSKHVLLQIHDPNRRVCSWRREWHAFTEATGPPNNRWTSKKLSSFRCLELRKEDQHTFSKTCPIFAEPSRIFCKMSAQTANVSCFCQGAEAFREILHWVLHLVEVCFQFSQFSQDFDSKCFIPKKWLQMYPQKCEVWSVKRKTNEIGNFSMKGPERTSTPMGSAALRCTRLSRPGRVRQLPVAAVGVRPKAPTLAPRDMISFKQNNATKLETWACSTLGMQEQKLKPMLLNKGWKCISFSTKRPVLWRNPSLHLGIWDAKPAISGRGRWASQVPAI